jgi:MFS family permease
MAARRRDAAGDPPARRPDDRPVARRGGAWEWVLLATVLGSSMAMLDGTVVNLALPRIAEDLDASFSGLQWILNGYTLALAALILVGGGLGDRYGRRRMFVAGAVAFTLASVLCAVSMNVPMLIGSAHRPGRRCGRLTPGSLAIIEASFAPEDPRPGDRHVDRPRRRGDGDRTVPRRLARRCRVVAVDLPAQRAARRRRRGRRGAPRPRDARSLRRRPDGCAGSGARRARARGPHARAHQESWPLALAGVALLAAFLVVERRARQPLVPLGLFSSSTFSGTNAVTLLLYGALAVVFFLLGLVLQGPLGYSPLQAGAATVPITVAMLLLSARPGSSPSASGRGSR